MLPADRFVIAHQSLVRPFERWGFVALLTGNTFLAFSLLAGILRQPALATISLQQPMQFTLLAGLIIGVAQWLVIRPYIPGWKWILTAFAWAFFMSLLIIAAQQLGLSDGLPPTLSGAPLPTPSVPRVLLAIGTLLGVLVIAPYVQWLVLRPYVQKVRWWLWLPSIVLVVQIPPVLLFRLVLPVAFNSAIFASCMNGLVLSIAFCCLQRPPKSQDKILQTPLAIAPDITDYWQARNLAKTLNLQMAKVWQTDLDDAVGKLQYLVGVNANCAEIYYEPLTPVARESVGATPLADGAQLLADGEIGSKLAKFQVVFTPPATIQVQPWQGISLVWLSIGLYVLILAISLICGSL